MRALLGLLLFGFMGSIAIADGPGQTVVPMKNGNFAIVGTPVQTKAGPPVEFRVGVGFQGPAQVATYAVELWLGADTCETIALEKSVQTPTGATGIGFILISINPPPCDNGWWWFIVIKSADDTLLTWTDPEFTAKP